MRKHILIMLISLTALVSAQAQEMNRRIFSQEAGGEILIGYGDRSGMEEPPFSEWFSREYDAYRPDSSLLEKITCPYLPEVEVTVVLGTWCPDSRREVPRFFRVADALGIPGDHIRVIYVDRHKKAPGINTDSLRIERVPTFIFTLYGKEAGRIVEVPRGSFEKEIKRICRVMSDEGF